MRKFLLYMFCLALLVAAIPLSLAGASPTRAAHWGKCPNTVEDAIRHASWRGTPLSQLRRPMSCKYLARRGTNLTFWEFRRLGSLHFYTGTTRIHAYLCQQPPGRYYACHEAHITFFVGTYN